MSHYNVFFKCIHVSLCTKGEYSFVSFSRLQLISAARFYFSSGDFFLNVADGATNYIYYVSYK